MIETITYSCSQSGSIVSEGGERLLRLSDILAPRGPIPVSKSSWWVGVRSGRYPRPFKLSSRVTVWRMRDITALVEGSFVSGEK